MKKVIASIAILFSLSACNDGKNTDSTTNATDTLQRGVDSGGIKQDPNMNNMNNMTNDSGFRQGGSHTN